MPKTAIDRIIKRTESLLPGTPAHDGQNDPRWQAILCIADFIASNPDKVWKFVRRWGMHKQKDLRAAIACCLLEHLLEHHFDLIFPRVKDASKRSKFFADTFISCWKLGESKFPENSKKFDRLKKWCMKRSDSK